MLDLVAHLIAWCQSCVPDAQSVAPTVGIIGGTAGAIGAIGGLAGAGSGAVTGASAADPSAETGDDAASPAADDSSGPSESPSPFNDTTGGFQMHEPPDPPAFPDDPFHSPSANPQPIFSDGSQVDASNNPGDDTTETDYINPDGTPLGSSPPAAPHHAPGNPTHKTK